MSSKDYGNLTGGDWDYVTDEGYSFDDYFGLSAWRQQREDDFLNHRWSPGNPAAEQMLHASSKQDYKALMQAAIDWELAQQKYHQELSDQIALRDEQREYDSPAQQIARQRKAGINPDLQSGSGGSSVGGSSSPISAPTMAETDLSMPLESPYGTADRVFGGISAVSGAISSISGAFDVGINFIEKMQTWQDRMTVSSNAAKLSDQAVKSGKIKAVDDSLQLIGNLASQLDGTKEYTDDELSQFISDWTGEQDEDGTQLRKLRHYMSSPESQKRYADIARQTMASQAAYRSIPLNFFTQQADSFYKLTQQDTRMQLLFGAMKEAYAKAFYTPENGELAGQIASQQLTNESNAVQLQSDAIEQQKVEFKDYLKQYGKGLEQIAAHEKFIADELAKLAKIPKEQRTPFIENRILSLQLDQFRLHQIGAKNFNELRQFALSLGNETSTFNQQVTIQKGNRGTYYVNEKNGYFNEDLHLLNAATWSDVVYNQYGHEDVVKAAIGGTALVISAGLSAGGTAIAAGAAASAKIGAAAIHKGAAYSAADALLDDKYNWLMGVNYLD